MSTQIEKTQPQSFAQKPSHESHRKTEKFSNQIHEVIGFLRNNIKDRELLHRSNFVLLESIANFFVNQEERKDEICNAFPNSKFSLTISWHAFDHSHRLLFEELNNIQKEYSKDSQSAVTMILRRIEHGGMQKLLKECCNAGCHYITAVQKAENVKVIEEFSRHGSHGHKSVMVANP